MLWNPITETTFVGISVNLCKNETCQTYLKIFHGVLQRFDGVSTVCSLYGAGITEEQALIQAIVPEHLVVLQTLPLPHVIERLHQRMLSERRQLQMRLNVLRAHGHFTLQAGFNRHWTLPVFARLLGTVITANLGGSVRRVAPALGGAL